MSISSIGNEAFYVGAVAAGTSSTSRRADGSQPALRRRRGGEGRLLRGAEQALGMMGLVLPAVAEDAEEDAAHSEGQEEGVVATALPPPAREALYKLLHDLFDAAHAQEAAATLAGHEGLSFDLSALLDTLAGAGSDSAPQVLAARDVLQSDFVDFLSALGLPSEAPGSASPDVLIFLKNLEASSGSDVPVSGGLWDVSE